MIKGFKPQTKEELLALYVAKALDDVKSLPFYLSCTKHFSDDYIREALHAVRKEAIQKIKKQTDHIF